MAHGKYWNKFYKRIKNVYENQLIDFHKRFYAFHEQNKNAIKFNYKLMMKEQKLLIMDYK